MSRCPCCENTHPQETPAYLLSPQHGKRGCASCGDLKEVISLPQPSAFLCIKWRWLSLLLLPLFILDDGVHDDEDFYRLRSACPGNITFEPLLSRLPASAHEAQTPAPTAHSPNKSRFEHKELKHGSACAEGGSAGSPVVPLPAVSSRATGSRVCFLALVLRCLTSSKPWWFAHRTHSFAPVPKLDISPRPLLPWLTFKKVWYCPVDAAGRGAGCVFWLFPAVLLHTWLQAGSMMSLLPHPWQSGSEPLVALVESRQHPMLACFFREEGEAVPEGPLVKKVKKRAFK